MLSFSNSQIANSTTSSPSQTSSTTIVNQHVYSEHASTVTTTTTAGILSSLAPLHDNISVTTNSTTTASTKTSAEVPIITNTTDSQEISTESVDVVDSTTILIEEDFVQSSSTHPDEIEYLTTLDSDDSTTEPHISTLDVAKINTTSGIVSIKNEAIEIPPEVPGNIVSNTTKDESISMKPSGVNYSEIQQDHPIYIYGHEEVEIVKLKDDLPIKYDRDIKRDDVSKELTDSNLSIIPDTVYDSADLKKLTPNTVHSKLHDDFDLNNTTNTSQAQASTAPPNVRTIKIPPIIPSISTTSSKRVLVNVTISTDPDSANPYAPQNVYVLSVSVPTDGDPKQDANVLNAESYMQPSALTRIDAPPDTYAKESPPTTKKPYEYWGGECQCNCPCLEGKTDLSEKEESDDFLLFDNSSAPDGGSIIKINNTIEIESAGNATYSTENAVEDISTTTEDASSWTTETSCPDFTTKLPPPPTILILEGRTANAISTAWQNNRAEPS